MANPNLLSITTVQGKTAVQAVGDSATAIVTNSSASGEVYKVNSLYVANVNSLNNGTISVDIFRSSTAYHIVRQVVVPVGSTLDVLSNPIYLEEGDSLRLTADSASVLEAVCSYEVIN